MIDQLKELMSNKPFASFRIVLTSGTKYEVLSQFQLAIGESQANYCYARSDRKANLRRNQVAAFEVLEETKS